MSATKTMSVRSYGSLHIENAGVTEITPLHILQAMEENFNRPMTTHLSPMSRRETFKNVSLVDLIKADPVFCPVAEALDGLKERRALADAKWKRDLMLWRNFGRPKWLPKDELAIVEKAGAELELVEDKLAAGYYATMQVASRKAWKKEQDRAQDPANYADLTLTYDLPPRTKRKSHEPAYYSITGPSGVTIDLGKPHGSYPPILSKNPNEAFRRFIARLGYSMKGGEVEILNRLLKAPQVEYVDAQGNVSKEWKWLPSYQTTLAPWDNWLQNIWLVKVGWRLNPKIAPSRYWLDADGELTQDDPNAGLEPGDEGYEAPLTLSQLDYHLLCDSKDLAVQDEDGNVVDYMNEEEEFLGWFGDREESETFIDLEQFVAGEGEGDFDDDELRLIKECSFNIDRSESGITMGDLQSQQFITHIDEQIREAEAELELVDCFGEDTPEAAAAAKKLARANNVDKAWNRFVGTQHDHALIRYWYPTGANRMLTMGLDMDFLREMPQEIAGASFSPTNSITPEIVTERESMPKTRGFSLSLDDAKQIRRQKHVCRAINNGYFPHLIREKAAQSEFERALEEALRAVG
jgi:hypothetical protein